jgi:hypothetical protein
VRGVGVGLVLCGLGLVAGGGLACPGAGLGWSGQGGGGPGWSGGVLASVGLRVGLQSGGDVPSQAKDR